MSPPNSAARVHVHFCIGPYPTPTAGQHAADCSCGWTGPVSGSYSVAVEAWQRHKENARNRAA